MKKLLLGALAVGLLGLAPLCRAGGSGISPQQLALQDRLEQRISCEFQGVPLTEVLQYFRDTLQVNIALNALWEQEQAPVTLALKDVPARTALRWAIRQAGLRYVLLDGTVCVAPPEIALRAEPTYFKQYDVMDLAGPPGTGFGQAAGNASVGGEDEALVRFLAQCTGQMQWDAVSPGGDAAGAPTQNRETP
jgi:hypothetical protein